MCGGGGTYAYISIHILTDLLERQTDRQRDAHKHIYIDKSSIRLTPLYAHNPVSVWPGHLGMIMP